MKQLLNIIFSISAFIIIPNINAQSNHISIFEGNGNSEINNFEVDNQNNIIAAGFYDGNIDLDPGQSNLSQTSAGLNNGFLIKTNEIGDLIWSKNFAGPVQVYANSVGLDDSNNVYVTGIYEGYLAFDNNSADDTLQSAGDFDIFVLKYSPSGNLLWSKRLGDSLKELSPVIHVGKDGFLYLTASFEGTVNFGTNGVLDTRTSSGQQDIFILKMDVLGNSIWVKQIEGVDYKYSGGLSADAQGNVYTTGSFASTVNFDQGISPATSKTSNGGTDIFIAKYKNTGNLSWVNQIGSFGFDIGITVSLDQSGNIIASGSYSATADFDAGPGVQNLNSNGSRDIYITKLDSSGNLIWANSIGGTGLDLSAGLFVNSINEILLAGRFFNSVDFDPGVGFSNLTSWGLSDAYLTKLSSNGMHLGSFKVGGTANDFGNSVYESNNGSVILGGSITDSATFYSSNSFRLSNSNKGAFIFSLPNSSVGINTVAKNVFTLSFNNISSNQFNIKLNMNEVINADLYNLNGQLIQSFTIQNEINFGSNLPKGSYILNLNNGFEQQSVKLFKL